MPSSPSHELPPATPLVITTDSKVNELPKPEALRSPDVLKAAPENNATEPVTSTKIEQGDAVTDSNTTIKMGERAKPIKSFSNKKS